MSVEIADDDAPARLSTTFVTHYPDVEAFCRAIPAVMALKLDRAVLRGS